MSDFNLTRTSKKQYSFFLSYETLKKKRLSLENFLCIFL